MQHPKRQPHARGTHRRAQLGTTISEFVYLTLIVTDSWFQAAAERKLVEKLKGLGYMRPVAGEATTSTAH